MNISTSLICCDLANVSADTDIIVEHDGFNWLHADFMDGHFVPRYGISPELIKSLRNRYRDKIIIDSHLMVDDPYAYAEVIAPYSDWFFFHYEATTDPMRTLQMLRKKYPNLKIGLVFNILTPIVVIMAVIDVANKLGYLDGVMFMGISPGVLGTKSFPEEVASRISTTKMLNENIKIFIDGSVNYDTLPNYHKLGADVCVSGSSMMFKPIDYNSFASRTEIITYNIDKIKSIIL